MDSKPRCRPPPSAAESQNADGQPGSLPTSSRRDSDHHREVQQLYEEMEQQIHWEKQQLQAQVGFPQQPAPSLCPDTSVGQAVGPVTGQMGQQEVAGSGSSHMPNQRMG